MAEQAPAALRAEDAGALLGLRLPEALARLGPGVTPVIQRTAPPRPRVPLPASDAGWRVVRVDAAGWVVAPCSELPGSQDVLE